MWILYNFHVMKYSLNFFQLFKNIKIILSQWASLPTSALNKSLAFTTFLQLSRPKVKEPNIKLGEIRDTQKDQYRMTSLI